MPTCRPCTRHGHCAYPSIYEGFGLPPIEMMACGGAVLAGTAGAIVETVGRKADLIPPRDLDGGGRPCCDVATDDDWWRQASQGGSSWSPNPIPGRPARPRPRALSIVAGELPATREYRAAG